MRKRVLSGPFRSAARLETDLKWVERFIWVYFWLLILEGALRKWMLPGLSAPLLIVRDPVVIAIYWAAYRSGRVRNTPLLGATVATAFIIAALAILQVGLGITTLPIALYGWRSYALHLPLIAIVGQVFSPADVRRLGSWVLKASIPMAVLMILQYRAAPNSWLNAGAGEASGQITSAAGHFRASGTFSFSTGAVSFITLSFAFLIDGLTSPRRYGRKLLWFSALATLAAIPMAGSRTLLFTCAGVAMLAPLAFIGNPASVARLFKIAAGLSLLTVLLAQTPMIREATETLELRWRQASGAEGSAGEILEERVLPSLIDPFSSLNDVPLLGTGIGMGSNVAASLTTGSVQFLMGEGEWSRVVLEFGPLFGPICLLLRVLLALTLAVNAFKAASRRLPLGMLLAATALPGLIMGLMEQPTSLGFIVFGTGLTLAAVSPSGIRQSTFQRLRAKKRHQHTIPFDLDSAQAFGRAV